MSEKNNDYISKRQDYLFFSVIICLIFVLVMMFITLNNHKILLNNQETLHINHKNIVEMCGDYISENEEL